MLRLALLAGRELQHSNSALKLISTGLRGISTSVPTAQGNSLASMLATVNTSSSQSVLQSMASLKHSIQPMYPAGSSGTALGLQAKIALGALAVIAYTSLDHAAAGHEWITELCMAVLVSGAWITIISVVPARSVRLALRDSAPHTAAPLKALRSTIGLKY